MEKNNTDNGKPCGIPFSVDGKLEKCPSTLTMKLLFGYEWVQQI